MQNSFIPSRTPGQWLLSSVGWTATCLLGAWVVNPVAYKIIMANSAADNDSFNVMVLVALSTYCVAHSLIWWLGLSGSSAVIRQAKKGGIFSWATLVAEVWQGVLSCFQLICLALLPLLLLVALLLVGNVDIAPHFG